MFAVPFTIAQLRGWKKFGGAWLARQLIKKEGMGPIADLISCSWVRLCVASEAVGDFLDAACNNTLFFVFCSSYVEAEMHGDYNAFSADLDIAWWLWEHD